MIYSDPVTQQGLIEHVRGLVKASEENYPETMLRRYANMALTDYSALALASSSNWQFDDSAWNDTPVATTDLEAGRYEYEFDDSFLIVRRVEIKFPSSSTWRELQYKNELQIPNISDRHETQQGQPFWWYIKGNSIYLVGTPDQTVVGGLRVHYERKMKPFDGNPNQQITLPSLHENWLVYKTAHLFAVQENLANRGDILNLLAQAELAAGDFFTRRLRTHKPRLIPTPTRSD